MSAKPSRPQPQVNTTYEIFIGAVSILAVVNIGLIFLSHSRIVDEVLYVTDFLLSLLFFGDFVVRLIRAPSRMGYLVHGWGWADLLSCVPMYQFKIFRLGRIWSVAKTLLNHHPKQILRNIAQRAESALLLVILFVILIAEFGGIGIAYAEGPSPRANIQTGADAIWYVFVTITTVGYGDYYPVTLQGRMIGLGIMFAGVGVLAVFTGFIANIFLRPPLRKLDADVVATDARSQLVAIQEELAEHERAFAELRKRLNDIEKAL